MRALASYFMIQTFAQASNIFTIGFGIDAVILGWAMMLPPLRRRAGRSVSRPPVRQYTRWGRRKLLGAVLGVCFLCAMWWADASWRITTLLIYIDVVGTLCCLCYGLHTMAWTSVG